MSLESVGDAMVDSTVKNLLRRLILGLQVSSERGNQGFPRSLAFKKLLPLAPQALELRRRYPNRLAFSVII